VNLGVNMPDDDVEFIDQSADGHGLGVRSGVIIARWHYCGEESRPVAGFPLHSAEWRILDDVL